MVLVLFFFFQAEDGIRDLVRSRGLGDVYKRQPLLQAGFHHDDDAADSHAVANGDPDFRDRAIHRRCLLYTSDAADERSSVDLGGRRIIKNKNNSTIHSHPHYKNSNTTASRETSNH